MLHRGVVKLRYTCDASRKLAHKKNCKLAHRTFFFKVKKTTSTNRLYYGNERMKISGNRQTKLGKTSVEIANSC